MPAKLRISPRKILVNGNVRWLVEATVSGKRTRSTFLTRDAAMDHAGILERQSGSLSSLFTDFDAGQIATISAELARLGAVDRLHRAVDLWLEDEAKRSVRAPVNEVLREFMEEKKSLKCRKVTLYNYDYYVRKFSTIISNKCVCDVTEADCRAFIESKAKTAAGINGLLCYMGSFFEFARKKGYARENPFSKLKRPKSDDKAPGILTPQEARALIEFCRHRQPEHVANFAIQLFAGLRPDEAMQIEWRDIRPGLIEVSGSKAKSRKRRLVEIQPNLAAWLAIKGKLPVERHEHYKALSFMKNHLNIKWTPDCMRHSFASYHLAKFQSADKTAHQMGHASTQMLFAHYRELVTPRDAEDYFNIFPL